jgi:FkbM family methyltransferase
MVAGGERTLGVAVRRAVQTPRVFSNWPSIFWAMAREGVGRGPSTLTFEPRSGQTITVPNAPGARLPAYEMYAEDTYDVHWFVGDLAAEPIHVLDVGAHVGTFSCLLGAVHPRAIVDALEPSPEALSFLRRNIEANGLGDRVRVHEAALAAQSGSAVLDVRGEASIHSRLSGDEETEGTEVQTMSFDDAVAAAGGLVDLVKLDCEGGEYSLYESSPHSWRAVRRVVLEYHATERESWPTLRDWFTEHGLEVVKDVPVPGVPNLGRAWLSR